MSNKLKDNPLKTISDLRNALNIIDAEKRKTDSKLAGMVRILTKSKTSDERKIDIFQSFEIPDTERKLKSYIGILEEELREAEDDLDNSEESKSLSSKQRLIDLLTSLLDDADERLQSIYSEKPGKPIYHTNNAFIERLNSFLHRSKYQRARILCFSSIALIILLAISLLTLSYDTIDYSSTISRIRGGSFQVKSAVVLPPAEPSTLTEVPTIQDDVQEIDWSVYDFSLDEVPDYTNSPFVEINGNKPFFTDAQLAVSKIEEYRDRDTLGRCTQAIVLLDKSMMPTAPRGNIGYMKPSGWHTVKYNEVIDDLYLYNRCHLIAYELTGQNDNGNNLITGTRYMNVEGMLPFENKVADYLSNSDNHVLYRVTPIFRNDNLVASGVLMEAESIEDQGSDICFCVYCYNVQPNIQISYEDGSSSLSPEYVAKKEREEQKVAEEARQNEEQEKSSAEQVQVLTPTDSIDESSSPSRSYSNSTASSSEQLAINENDDSITVYITDTGHKYHTYGCQHLRDSKHEVSLAEAKSMGLGPCGTCHPPQ